jgi:hypothetical protein
MWKKTWLLGILMAVSAVSGAGCNCGGTTTPGDPDGGNTTTDGGQNGGGGSNPDGGGEDPTNPGNGVTLTSLSIEPTTVTLNASDTAAATQKFKITGTYSDKNTKDLSNQSSFSVDDTRLGFFEGPSFLTRMGVAAVGGTSTVRARVGTMSVSANVTVKLQQNTSDSPPTGSTPAPTPVPAQPEDKFGGTVSATRKPSILYPNSGVMVPPNLGQLEFHFNPGPSTNTLFQLSFTNAITDVRVHLRCYLPTGFTMPTTLPQGMTRGCIYTPSADVWRFLAESNRGGQPVQVTLKATGDTGGTVGVSDPILLNFARSEIKGALYYWTTSGNTAVMRYDFAGTAGQKQATPALTRGDINPATPAVTCVGCHALSRNGKKLVAEVNGQNDGRLALVDLSNFTSGTSKVSLAQSGTKLSNFESWNPDGSKFVGVYADEGATRFNLMLFNGTDAKFEKEITGTGTSTNPANHPDWSADGQTIAYMSMGIRETNQRSYRGAIRMVKAQAGDTWSSPVTVVPAVSRKNRYYPAIAPDNSFLVFNESSCPSGTTDRETDCNSDTDPSATLWAARLQASATPVALTRANAPGPMDQGATNLTNSYPKWSPFVTRGNGSDTSKLMWVTFSSSRNYGLRTPPEPSNKTENPKGTLLWMAAVDPDKVAQGVDPSSPAFALPFQDLGTSNHIAQWAEYLVSNGCSTVGEGCGSGGSTCCNGLQCVQLNQDPPVPCSINGACVCQPIPQCAPAFEKCSAVAPCCDGNRCLDTSGNDCQGGDCSCKPPCSGVGQACGGASACCDGLKCSTSESGTTCRPIIN